jgi:N-acetylglucosaminyldiphosphoundecaprenol N-acetyl-beta-D-mannosaminyltransferase
VSRVDVLGVKFDALDLERAVRAIIALTMTPGPHLVVTANVELLMRARRASDLQDILRRAALVVADGIGVVWGSGQLGSPLPGRVPGIDLADRLCAEAARLGWRVALVGGAPGVAQAAAARLQRVHPGVVVAAALHGYFTAGEEQDVLRVIRDASPTLLLAGLGSPRQERWLDRHLTTLAVPISLGIGGTLDVWAGRVSRAPRVMQTLGLEWCYRLIRQPGRLRRQVVIPQFMATVWRLRAQRRRP